MNLALGFGLQKVALGAVLNQEPPIENFQTLVNSKFTEKLIGNDSTFAGAGSWEVGLGSLAADVTTVPGSMLLNFTSGNQAVKIVGKVEAGTKGYLVKIKCKLHAGTGTILQIGSFAGSVDPNYGVNIVPDSTLRWYYGYLSNFATTTFYIGVVNANNNGTDFLIDEIHIVEVALSDLYNLDISEQAKYYTSGLFSGLSKAASKLLKINVMGDSLMANNNANLPALVDEGVNLRPARLDTNTIPRRYYDVNKYNAPSFRKFSHADWVKSNPANWEAIYCFGSTSGDTHYKSITANSYAEIIVPDGQTDFAIIYEVAGITYDEAVAVTINGGSIAAYGDSVIAGGNATYYENALKVAHYTGLPAGANTIRITKANNTKPFTIWGGCWWTGNTMVLLNHAYGGWSIDPIVSKVSSHIENHALYNWLIELPNINNCGQSIAAATQVKQMLRLLSTKGIQFANTVFFTTYPPGTDPTDGTPNYYLTQNTPLTFKQRSTMDISLLVYIGCYFVDIFRYFEEDIITRGGTLAGGESGTYYTSDGIHPTDSGAGKFAGFLNPKIPDIP